MAVYAKSLMMVLATILTAIVAGLTDGAITEGEWITVAIAGVTAAAVFTGPNVPGAPITKAILAVLGAVLAFLTSAITDGISMSEWLNIGVIALGAVGVYAVPNRAAHPAVGENGLGEPL